MSKCAIDRIEGALAVVVSGLWPEIVSLPEARRWVALRPLIGQRLAGDVGCDVALRLAERIRQRPALVVAEIESRLPSAVRTQCIREGDYLNFSLLGEPIGAEEALTVESGRKVGVYIRPSHAAPGYLRLVARAVVQVTMLERAGSEVVVWHGANLRAERGVALFRELGLSHPDNAPVEKVAALALRVAPEVGELWVWCLGKDLGASFERQYVDRVRQNGVDTSVRAPSEAWLTCDPIPRNVWSWPDAQLHRFMWYAASAQLGVECDFTVPELEEQGNIAWYVEALVARISRVFNSLPQDIVVSTFTEDRLLQLAALLPLAARRAGTHGEVGEWLSHVAQLVNCAQRELNEPSFRQRVAKAEVSEQEIARFHVVARALIGV